MKTDKLTTKIKMLIQDEGPMHNGNLEKITGAVLLEYARGGTLKSAVRAVIQADKQEGVRSLQHGSQAAPRGY